ncbi:MAG: hypothetical protein E3J83_06345 [Candidatus Atribacteria bacterium]|nr:MAG: hypothetical protein E3J83_06345 [Candidatus Atribacteria bacterium]
MKKALMVIAIVAIVAIAGSLIYYFVFFKPGMERAEVQNNEAKEYLSEYNAIRQEFIDKLNLYIGGKDKDKILSELQGIRRKLMRLSIPEDYNKYNDVKSSCLNAMNECIDVLETARIYDASGTKVDDNKIKELADKLIKNKGILESLSIND